MSMAKFLGMNTKRVGIFARFRQQFAASLVRALEILLLIAAACGSAEAQYIGYATNSVDGTVSVFAVVTSGPTFGNEVAPGNQDHLIATVPVGANPVRIAVGPNLNKAYVTNRDNSMWVIDITKISQEAISPGSVTATNINPNNVFKLSNPFGIAIASVTQGVNKGRALAFVANQGTNTVSVIDTSNDSFVGTVSLGTTSAAPFPEVAVTPDGNQVIVIALSQCSSGTCGVICMIDATSVASGTSATLVPVTGPVGSAAGALSIPSGISTTQYTDSLNQLHTLVVVSDSGTRQGGNGYVYVLDRVAGLTVSTTPIAIPNSSSLGDVAALNLTRVLGAPIDAEVLDQVGSTISLIANIDTLTPSVFSTLSLNSAADRLAVTPDTGFTYVTEGFSGQKGQVQLVDNLFFGAETGVNFCLADGFLCSNNTSVTVGTETTGIAISGLDPTSPAVVWFIPPVSGGFPPPSAPLALGPNGAQLAVSGESMVGDPTQLIQTILSFGSGKNSCAIFDTSKGISGTPTPDDCTANATINGSGGNGIGGTGTFPASGVFTISLGTTQNGGSTTETVTVGANCTLSSASVTPTTNVAVGQTVTANISCTAPGNDQLAGNVQWGDGTVAVSSQPVLANGSTPVILTFTHQYTAPSTSAGYPVAVSITDNSETRAASVTGGPISVVVLPVTALVNCTLSTSSGNVQTGQTVTATFTCTAPPNDSLTSTIDWGDKSTASTGTAAADANGSATFTFTHTYASTSNPIFTVTGTIKEVATSFAGSVTVTSGAITVIGPPVISPSPSQATTTIAQGQPETVTVNFSGGSADAGLKFTSITWSVSPIGMTCTISPSTLTLDANGNGSVQVTMHTVGPGSSLAIPQGGDRQTPLFAFLLVLPGLGFVFLGAGFSMSKARNRAPWGLLLLLLTVALILSTGACTSIQRSNIPCTSCTTPQAYTVTITARSTSPAFQASGIFTVNVVQ
jgi:YVTN family beta-propeller protein